MRAIRAVLITLVVLGVLFVAADRISVAVAEHEAANEFKKSQPIEGGASVSIKGFPFLTQVLDGDIHRVHASAKGIVAEAQGGSLRITRFDADLHDVKLSDGFSTATAHTVDGTALISYKDLSDAAPDGVTVSYGGRSDEPGTSKVKVTGRITIPVLGKTWQRSVTSDVRLEGGNRVTLHARSIPDTGIPGLADEVRKRIDFSQQVTGLPEGIRLDEVKAGPDGVTIKVSGTGVSLSR
jgi:LmeA-like phospholipid-binding